jgi:hypothetical protein
VIAEILGIRNAKTTNDTTVAVLNDWLRLNADEADLKKRLKDAEAALDTKAYAHYPRLSDRSINPLSYACRTHRVRKLGNCLFDDRNDERLSSSDWRPFVLEHFEITETELKAIAAPASIGFRSKPVNG